jgi:hypothetical protein
MRAFFLIAFFALSPLSQAFAANTPPGFESTRWEKLVGLVAFIGDQYDIGDGVQLRSFASIIPTDKTVPHKADYFSTIGLVDTFRKYHPNEISAVSEDWRKQTNGNWEIEQWIWKVSLSGELRGVMHGLIVKTPDNTIVEMKNLPVGNADAPEELARWGAKLNEWYKLKP